MEKETLEEAAVINYKKLYEGEPLTQDTPIDAFKDGAKWNQERSYSEEEVMDIIYSYSKWKYHMKEDEFYIDVWFEQFKKK